MPKTRGGGGLLAVDANEEVNAQSVNRIHQKLPVYLHYMQPLCYSALTFSVIMASQNTKTLTPSLSAVHRTLSVLSSLCGPCFIFADSNSACPFSLAVSATGRWNPRLTLNSGRFGNLIFEAGQGYTGLHPSLRNTHSILMSLQCYNDFQFSQRVVSLV